MEEVLLPEPPEVVPEVLHEHMELSHYIDVFRSSAERVRRVIFIIMVFSVVMFVAQWNTTGLSSVSRHYEGLESLYGNVKSLSKELADDAVNKASKGQLQTLEELRDYLDEFRGQRLDRVVFVDIPGLGVTFDVNDLGNFSGIAYTLLMTLLLFSLAREHENLYLAMFKVRRLHEHGKRKSDGESTANYLYHSLAMNQVLNSPPTLAQWDPSKNRTRVLYVIFLVPAFVEGCVIYMNLKTMWVAKFLGMNNSVMIPQYIFFSVILILGLLAIVYSRSCDRRWQRTFFYINPALRRVRSRPWHVWVGLGTGSPLHRRMWNQAVAVDRLVVKEREARAKRPVEVAASVSIGEGEKISYEAMEELCMKLEREAAGAAGVSERVVSRSPREIKSSVLDDGAWTVTASFFDQGLRNVIKSHLGSEQADSIHRIAEFLVQAQLGGRHDELERLMHPSAVLVGPGFAGRFEPGKDSLKSYWEFEEGAKVESLELGEFTVEAWGTTAVVTCPFTVRYRLEDVLYQESGSDVIVLSHEGRSWQVIWRTLIVERAEST